MSQMLVEMDGDTQVVLNGQCVLLCEVPLGKEFTLDGNTFQSCTDLSTYRQLQVGARFKYGDRWFYKGETNGQYPLENNRPFGKPFFLRDGRDFEGGEKVMVLELRQR